MSELCHSYFYKEHNEYVRSGTGSLSYEGKNFYSYYTTIGYLYEDKKGHKTFMVSDNTMSATTGKHLSYIRSACPFDMIYVPFKYGEKVYGTQKDVVKWLCGRFAELLKLDMKEKKTYTRKADREYSTGLLHEMESFISVTGAKVKGYSAYKKHLDNALNSENIKKASARVRELAKKKAEKMRKAVEHFKKVVSKKDLLDLVDKYVLEWTYTGKSAYELKEKELFESMFGVENPSFVGLCKDKNAVRTSQRIVMPVCEIITALKCWKHKHNIVGFKLGGYTILANNDKFVKIGCHNIPTENIKALASALL